MSSRRLEPAAKVAKAAKPPQPPVEAVTSAAVAGAEAGTGAGAGVTSSPARKQFKRCHGKCVQKFCLPIGDLSVYDSCSAKCKGEKLQYL